jgi:transglutaminase-like putative cysteine protease
MRVSVFIRSLPLLFVITSPALLRAQFQQPTDEELKMTADPKAPGAAAVYLNIEESTNDPFHDMSFYARIKVLTEKGKELASVEIPYLDSGYEITDIQARTIHADGTVVPLVGKPADLLISKTAIKYGDLEVNEKVFTLPSVEVGSILEYRYQVRYSEHVVSSPTWNIQKPYFVHKAHYTFTPWKAFMRDSADSTGSYLLDARRRPLNMLLWWTQLPPGTELKRDGFGRFSLDLTDIPPEPQEQWMPPIRSLLYRVLFYYKYASNNQEFWAGETKLWSKDVDHFAELTKAIHDAVNGLVAPTDSALDKAKKLYKAVQALENTDYSRKKSASEMKQLNLKAAKRAEDTWAQKSGDSEDIALLYIAMLRAAGLTAYDLKLVNREEGIFDNGYLNFDQLDDDVVILAIGGQEILLDPGEKMCPFQTLHWSHSGASGARQSPDGHYAATTPLQYYKPNSLVRIGDVNVDEHGSITGAFRFIMTGQEALRWRQAALRNDLDEVKKQFDHSLESTLPEGVEAHVDHFLQLDDPDAALMAIVNVRGALGTATSKRLMLPAFFFETRGAHPFVAQETRLEAVDMHYGEQTTDEVSYRIPESLAVEGAPQDATVTWKDHAVFVTKTVSAPGSVTVGRTLARAFTVAQPAEYQDLRGFYQKLAAADQAQLVLAKTAHTGTEN